MRLYTEEELGPCRATVTIDALTVRRGAEQIAAFFVHETWTQPGKGTIVETTRADTIDDARKLAFDAITEWRAGTARSERLAPGGVLRRG